MRLSAVLVICMMLGSVGCAKTQLPPGHRGDASADVKSGGQSLRRAILSPFAKLGDMFFVPIDDPAAENPQRPLIDPNEAYRFGYNTRWNSAVSMGGHRKVRHAVLLDDILVIVEDKTNFVTAVNVRDGAIRWQQTVGSPLDRLFEPLRFYDEILINSETHLYSLAVDSGQVIGQSAMEAAVVDRPSIVDNLAIFGGLHSRVFGHGIRTGRTHWAYEMTGGIVVRPVASGINIFVTDSNGVYAMLQGKIGHVLWKGQTFGRISAVPAINSLGVFVACEDQTLYAINRSFGSDRWTYRAPNPLKQSPTVLENTLFLPDPSGDVIAIDALNGEQLWRYNANAEPVTLADDRLIMFERTRLITLDAPTGSMLRQVAVQPLYKVIAGPDSSLILVNHKGRLMRLDPVR